MQKVIDIAEEKRVEHLDVSDNHVDTTVAGERVPNCHNARVSQRYKILRTSVA